MQLLDLKAVIRRKRYTYKPHKTQHIAENVLNREFQKDYNAMEVKKFYSFNIIHI